MNPLDGQPKLLTEINRPQLHYSNDSKKQRSVCLHEKESASEARTMRKAWFTDGRLHRRDFLKSLIMGGAAGFGMVASQNMGLISGLLVRTFVEGQVDPTYTVEQTGGLVQATPAPNSGLPSLSNTDAATVINEILQQSGMKVLIKAGTYTINSSISTPLNTNDLEIYGVNMADTILKLGDGVNNAVLEILGSTNVRIHDIQVDGNRANQQQSFGTGKLFLPLYAHGIDVWRSSNVAISNCNVHDCRVMGIQMLLCEDSTITGCRVVDSDANGITIGNHSAKDQAIGGNNIISQNIVDGASDVGITGLDPIDSIVEQNTIRNVNMNTSPFNQNTHIGMAVEKAGLAQHVIYRQNRIENCLGDGISTFGHTPDSGTDLIWDNNYITNCGNGLYANMVTGITITNNTVNGTLSSGDTSYGVTGFGLLIGPQVIRADVEGNNFMNIQAPVWPQNGLGSGGRRIIILLAPSGVLVNNLMFTTEPPIGPLQSPIFTTSMSDWTLSNNATINNPV